ncbi:MAG: hypothetical protein Q7R47_06910, partial [Candidatus Diapherotrites archaeon]|nr:hypothetical protein [Candidatus Diapherotrites archaeon]
SMNLKSWQKMVLGIVVVVAFILLSQVLLANNWFFALISQPCDASGGFVGIVREQCSCNGVKVDTTDCTNCSDTVNTTGCIGVVSQRTCYWPVTDDWGGIPCAGGGS